MIPPAKPSTMWAARLLPLLLLPGQACLAEGTRGLESAHQPVVSADGASVPGCGAWQGVSRDSAATTDLNFGCAVNGNLAAMIADPRDLLHGKSVEGGDPTSASRAYKMWYEAPPTGSQPLEKVNSKGGGQ